MQHNFLSDSFTSIVTLTSPLIATPHLATAGHVRVLPEYKLGRGSSTSSTHHPLQYSTDNSRDLFPPTNHQRGLRKHRHKPWLAKTVANALTSISVMVFAGAPSSGGLRNGHNLIDHHKHYKKSQTHATVRARPITRSAQASTRFHYPIARRPSK